MIISKDSSPRKEDVMVNYYVTLGLFTLVIGCIGTEWMALELLTNRKTVFGQEKHTC